MLIKIQKMDNDQLRVYNAMLYLCKHNSDMFIERVDKGDSWRYVLYIRIYHGYCFGELLGDLVVFK